MHLEVGSSPLEPPDEEAVCLKWLDGSVAKPRMQDPAKDQPARLTPETERQEICTVLATSFERISYAAINTKRIYCFMKEEGKPWRSYLILFKVTQSVSNKAQI